VRAELTFSARVQALVGTAHHPFGPGVTGCSRSGRRCCAPPR